LTHHSLRFERVLLCIAANFEILDPEKSAERMSA